jgi:hypothetical protein
MRFFGVSLGHTDDGQAETWVRRLGLSEQVRVCIHRVSTPVPHVAVSLAVPYGTAVELPTVVDRFAGAAVEAVTAHATGRSGHAVVFRGGRTVTGRTTVADVLAGSEIGAVLAPGDTVTAADVVDAGSGVTPRWRDGVLTLMAVRGPDGVLRQAPRSATT